ncbi:MAG: hypothetical protein WC942_05270 [Clostridia bacterium]|jgi:hypothetical protein
MNYQNYIMTNQSIMIIFDEGVKIVNNTSSMYDQIIALVKHKGRDDINSEELFKLVDIASRIRRHPSGRFDVVGDCVYIEGQVLPETLSKRIMQFTDSNVDYSILLRFWDNLKQNPSKEAINDLYKFIDHNHIPLTDDGCFIAYKAVTKDFKDKYTNTIDNRVGQHVSIPRDQVNDDRNVTCSYGLHVACYDYAHNFSGHDGVLISVKVNPKNVVSVPVDYDGTKMRVCAYEVIEVIHQPIEECYVDTHADEDDCRYDNGDLYYTDSSSMVLDL